MADEKPDFEALRKARNEAMWEAAKKLAVEMGWEEGDAPVRVFSDPDDCYCACVSGGPCEHNWQGYHEYETPEGGHVAETVCTRCGMGAMGHSLRVGM